MSITVISGTTPANTGQLATTASVSFDATFISQSYFNAWSSSATSANSASRAGGAGFNVNGINVVFYSGSTDPVNTANTIFINDVPFATTAANFTATASLVFNASASVAYSNTNFAALQGISASVSASTGLKFNVGTLGTYSTSYNLNTQNYVVSGSTTILFSGASTFGPAGSGKVTTGGPWSSILATANSLITVSGSALGVATFNLTTGNTYTASGSVLIEAITVNNPQGTVVAS